MPRLSIRLFVAVALFSSVVHAGASAPTSTRIVSAGEAWDGSPYREYPRGQPELVLERVILPPGAALPWHTHPAPAIGYVLSGALTVESRGNGSRHVRAGEALPESVGGVHRGVAGAEGAELLVFRASALGLPISVPAEVSR
jgi:quercetin dioxygenase-like cupin family protein